MRTVYEFFCGGGLARLGLGPGWRCAFANDIDKVKCEAYRANFGGEELTEGDVHDLTPGDLPGWADLAWASFPCQDLSLAGKRGGLNAPRSGAFFGFWRLMRGLAAEGRAPRTIVIENVSGFATSSAGRDLGVVLTALAVAGYRYDVRILDAAAFLPQSRPRLFIIAWISGLSAPLGAVDDPAAIARALAALPGAARAARRALNLPAPPPRNMNLTSLLDPDAAWMAADKAGPILAMMAPAQTRALTRAHEEAARAGRPVHGAAFRRMRQGAQRLEARWDMAGCLRTPAGGSSKQYVIEARPDGETALRRLTGREALRLMGAPDYLAPVSETQALKIAGDGVAAPVVRWIAAHALEPLLSPPLEPAAAAE